MTSPPVDIHIPPLMSVTQAADELDISRQAVLKQANAGQLRGRKVGNTWVFRPAVVERAKRARAKPDAGGTA